MSAHTISPAKKMKVDELIAMGGAVPQQPPSAPPPSEMLDELTKLYNEVYVPGLVLFFETRWYDFAKNRATTANPAAMLHNNQPLVSLFTSFIQTISKIKSTDPADMVYSGHLESSVVWSLACLPLSLSLPQRQQYPDPLPAEDDPWEAGGRLRVFETLLAGETLASNPLTPSSGGNVHPLRRNEFEFWYQLAKFLQQEHGSDSPADVSARDRCLNGMRALLDGRENRDVLYSIAVLREYTAHWDASFCEQNVPPHLEETDPRSKLAVATRFIRDESTSTGTTNVVRRLADLAYRAFVRPAVNVDRVRGRNSGTS
jgi:white-opaque regulator 2